MSNNVTDSNLYGAGYPIAFPVLGKPRSIIVKMIKEEHRSGLSFDSQCTAGTTHSITASNVTLYHHGISHPFWIQKENPVAMVAKLLMQIFKVLVVIFRSLHSMGLGNLGPPLLKGNCSIKEWVGELQVSSLTYCHLVGALRSRKSSLYQPSERLKKLDLPSGNQDKVKLDSNNYV